MPRKTTMKQAEAESHGAGGAVATKIPATLGTGNKNGLHLVPPPEGSSEATGAPAWAPYDAPPAEPVAERIRKLAKGEETIEVPPEIVEATAPESVTTDGTAGETSGPSEAALLGREMAIGGEPISACPYDAGTPEMQDWCASWEAAQAELETPAPGRADGLDTVNASIQEEIDASRQPHPEGHFDLFHGIPTDLVFEDADAEYIESEPLAEVGLRLVERHQEFKHLRGRDIRFYWRRNGGSPSNKISLGAAHHPAGLLRQTLENADWLIWLAADHLRQVKPTKRQVEACIFRQLCHAQETSKGKPTNAPHAFEGFTSELQHYGPWNTDLLAVLASLNRKPDPEAVQGALNLDSAASVGDMDAAE